MVAILIYASNGHKQLLGTWIKEKFGLRLYNLRIIFCIHSLILDFYYFA